ncbi:reverse transcriptase domain-containing protein [Tanacetum coccineum]
MLIRIPRASEIAIDGHCICPSHEIQRMEQELWTLTLKGDDIEAYNNRFHELALMCPELVPTEKKKIEKYVRGFPERIKGISTSQTVKLCMRKSTWPVKTGVAICSGTKQETKNVSHGNMLARPAGGTTIHYCWTIYSPINATGATYIIMDHVLRGAENVKELVTWRKIVELGSGLLLSRNTSKNDGARGKCLRGD